jgi:putative membrane protein insertion efficiency factor
MKWIPIFFIKLYQLTLSPFFGKDCRFAPTCSEYAIQAFQKHGFFKGCKLTVCRLLKCHPWHPGGVDEIP